ncbi:putative immunity protein [Pseudarthrobacter sp. PvP090]|uniref:putative immunity protein n=1 Tax=Pseudarthrobacter sp. PvP090 TaxID=3156393 RepID=UPI00339B6A28
MTIGRVRESNPCGPGSVTKFPNDRLSYRCLRSPCGGSQCDRSGRPDAVAAARVAGQAAAVAHMFDRSRHAATYAAKANLAGPGRRSQMPIAHDYVRCGWDLACWARAEP